MPKYKSPTRCTACLESDKDKVCLHHIKTRGSGGPDQSWNLLPLCHNCHVLVHTMGLKFFAVKNPSVHEWLKKNTWYLDTFTGKWRHDEN